MQDSNGKGGELEEGDDGEVGRSLTLIAVDMGAAAGRLEVGDEEGLSEDMLAFVDHLADFLAEEFAAALTKEGQDEGRGVCEVLEREPARAEHRRSGSGLS